MQRSDEVSLVHGAIDAAAVLAAVASEAAGANVLFVGTTRGITDGLVTRSLDYEAHEPMAREELARLRDEFGPTADIARIRLQLQFFGGRVSRALKLDWMLPDEDFDRAVSEGLSRCFPELTEEARLVIAGNYSYSHAK